MHGPKEKEILPTCARSPSYLYSQVKRLPSNLSSTSPIAFVGFANIGLRGTPGVNLHFSRSLSMPTSRIAGTTRSYVGSSLAKYYDQVGRVKNSLIVVPIYRLDNLSSLLQPGSELLFVQTFIRWLAISYWSVVILVSTHHVLALREQQHVLRRPRQYALRYLFEAFPPDYARCISLRLPGTLQEVS